MKKTYLLLLIFLSNISLALDLDDLKKGVEGIAKELDKNLQNEEKDSKSESVKQEAAPAPQEAAPAPQEAAPAPQEAVPAPQEAAPAPQEAAPASKLTQKQIEKKNKIYDHEKWDSTGNFSLLLSIEKKFFIKFSSKEFNKLKSFKEIKEIVTKKLKKKT